MTSADIRQSFLSFFESHAHAMVPSSPLLPSAPNLLFTNAGMNQFVPFFLGERTPPWTRVANTQKCIRAGGKHNDLEDVGYDTYHHTFFEMLGNWSFGDYFKAESLAWGWDLLTRVWGMPPRRLFATVYSPSPGDPAAFDQEAYDIWAGIFRSAGLDPAVHIVPGNRKDNFWMMGDTGPCGPCSEIHFNLLPSDDETAGRSLVNSGSPRCIEIWNHVFIQFNALPDGRFEPLAQRHVDTGMGFERVAGIHATSRGFTDFSAEPSNYNADAFTSIFATISRLSGHHYTATVPSRRDRLSPQEMHDVAFRVLADHARCISCAVADGILPGNEGRNYVIRRILRRGILYGQKLGLSTGFFEQLVEPVVAALGPVFPELKTHFDLIRRVIRAEEEAFGRTLQRGLARFHSHLESHPGASLIPGAVAFELYDTYGFPLDMTALLAREHGLDLDQDGFDAAMEAQRGRGRSAQKKEVIEVRSGTASAGSATHFVGFDPANLTAFPSTFLALETLPTSSPPRHFLLFSATPFYAEMGGQLGDTGVVLLPSGQSIRIVNTTKDPEGRFLHEIETPPLPALLEGTPVTLSVDLPRREAIQRHHTVTHILNWALRETLGTHIRQAGSLVSPEYLRFDFAHFEALTPAQLARLESLVNARIVENAPVAWYEIPLSEKPADVVAVFGEKYGSLVRVVDIGAGLDLGPDHTLRNRLAPGYSAELCGGTHVQATGQIGPFRILAESSISAGTRRIEAVAGFPALDLFSTTQATLRSLAGRLACSPAELEARLATLLEQKDHLEKALRAHEQKALAAQASTLAASALSRDGLTWVVARATAPNPNDLRALGAQVAASIGPGVVLLGANLDDKATLVAFASPEAIRAGHKAGDLIRDLAAQLDGKGGGKPDFAMGGGKAISRLDSVLQAFLASRS